MDVLYFKGTFDDNNVSRPSIYSSIYLSVYFFIYLIISCLKG